MRTTPAADAELVQAAVEDRAGVLIHHPIESRLRRPIVAAGGSHRGSAAGYLAAFGPLVGVRLGDVGQTAVALQRRAALVGPGVVDQREELQLVGGHAAVVCWRRS